MAKQLVAAIDGILVRVGDKIATLYKDGAVPPGADKDHVKVLVDRGLLVESDAPDAEDADSVPAKSASKGDWVDFAVSQGADQAEAEALTKDDLIAAYGGE